MDTIMSLFGGEIFLNNQNKALILHSKLKRTEAIEL